MANYGIKVENVLSKFYSVKQDEAIKGLYEVREKEKPDGDIMWYFFSSNNATFHSSGNDCVVRDINQSNSGYLGRLKAAFEKAKGKDKKIFWLVLVFGEGIGLAPDGYDWIASIELRVSLNDITASLSMRKYPVGKGKMGILNLVVSGWIKINILIQLLSVVGIKMEYLHQSIWTNISDCMTTARIMVLYGTHILIMQKFMIRNIRCNN